MRFKVSVVRLLGSACLLDSIEMVLEQIFLKGGQNRVVAVSSH